MHKIKFESILYDMKRGNARENQKRNALRAFFTDARASKQKGITQ